MESKSGKVLLNFVLVLALTISSGEALKCYECIAVGSGTDECNGDIVAKSGNDKIVECDMQSMRNFHSKLQGKPGLEQIASVFAVDVPQTSRGQTKTPMSCVKMTLKVGHEPVLLRSCQTAQTEMVKPCEVTKEKIKKNFAVIAKVESCDICEGDKCNGSGRKSSTLIMAFLPILASIICFLPRGA